MRGQNMGTKKMGPEQNNDSNSHPRPGPASQLLLFARNFLKHPNMVGWMLPSSPFVVDEVLKQVDWAEARNIVEYGPGIGTFTTEVLARMHPEAKLIALETNAEFFSFLNGSLR